MPSDPAGPVEPGPGHLKIGGGQRPVEAHSEQARLGVQQVGRRADPGTIAVLAHAHVLARRLDAAGRHFERGAGRAQVLQPRRDLETDPVLEVPKLLRSPRRPGRRLAPWRPTSAPRRTPCRTSPRTRTRCRATRPRGGRCAGSGTRSRTKPAKRPGAAPPLVPPSPGRPPPPRGPAGPRRRVACPGPAPRGPAPREWQYQRHPRGPDRSGHQSRSRPVLPLSPTVQPPLSPTPQSVAPSCPAGRSISRTRLAFSISARVLGLEARELGPVALHLHRQHVVAGRHAHLEQVASCLSGGIRRRRWPRAGRAPTARRPTSLQKAAVTSRRRSDWPASRVLPRGDLLSLGAFEGALHSAPRVEGLAQIGSERTPGWEGSGRPATAIRRSG